MVGKFKALRFAIMLVATALFGGSALAATSEPASDGQQIAAALVAQTTDMPAAQIAIAGPQNVYSVEPLGPPAATGEVIARVRTEAVDADWSAKHKFKSWEAHALFDCAGKRVRIVRSATYAEANLKGAAKVDDLGGSWFTPQAAEPAAVLLAAACDRNFAWPLRAATKPTPQTSDPAPLLKARLDKPEPAPAPSLAGAEPRMIEAAPKRAAASDWPTYEEAARVQKASVAVAAQEALAAQTSLGAQPARRSKVVAAPTSAIVAVKRWASAGESFVGRRASSVRRWFASRQPAPGELRQAAL